METSNPSTYTPIIFRDSDHRYFSKINPKIPSVTGILKAVSPKVDTRAIATEFLAKKGLYGPRYVFVLNMVGYIHDKLKMDLGEAFTKYKKESFDLPWLLRFWNNIKDTATEAGTNIHAHFEKRDAALIGSTYNPIVNDYKVSQDLSKLKNNHKYLEIIAHDHWHSLTGQIDVCDITNWLSDISDYKTDKDKPDKDLYFTNMLGAMSHLPYNNFYKHALQLNIYGQLLVPWGIPFNSATVRWIPTSYVKPKDLLPEHIVLATNKMSGLLKVSNGTWEKIPLPNLQDEAKELIRLNRLKKL